jgi:hypothetical protein
MTNSVQTVFSAKDSGLSRVFSNASKNASVFGKTAVSGFGQARAGVRAFGDAMPAGCRKYRA